MGIVTLLNAVGFNVQLKHVEDESETTRDRVEVKNEEGEVLASHDDMQHNRNYHDLTENNAKLLHQTIKSLDVQAG